MENRSQKAILDNEGKLSRATRDLGWIRASWGDGIRIFGYYQGKYVALGNADEVTEAVDHLDWLYWMNDSTSFHATVPVHPFKPFVPAPMNDEGRIDKDRLIEMVKFVVNVTRDTQQPKLAVLCLIRKFDQETAIRLIKNDVDLNLIDAL